MIADVKGRRSLAVSAMLVLLVLCSLLAGCDTATDAGSSSNTGSLASNPQLPGATVNNVRLGITINCVSWIILKPHQPTYSATELAQIKDILSKAAHPYSLGANIDPVGYSPDGLPPTLQFIFGSPSCKGTYEVTNTGNSLVQLNQVGFQDTAVPKKSTIDYRVIDACPYLSICVLSGLGETQPCKYYSNLDLNASQQSLALGKLEIQPPEGPDSGPPCPSVVNLKAGQTVDIQMFFSLQGNFPAATAHYEMQGVPALNITSAAGTKTITYPTLANTVDFLPLGDHGFPGTCYVQKGRTFVPVTSFSQVPDSSKYAQLPYYAPVCV
jgi:hypothetical protein